MDTNFPFKFAKEDFSINATSTTNSSYIRYMNVIEVDLNANTLTAMFGGAYSG
jgi:hypothetical protein